MLKLSNGLINHCVNSGCGWKCCDFGSEGHIIMLPTEYEKAGDVSHINVIDDDYMGGKKVKCVAKDKKTCDGGYKPIQCRTFPLWVRSDERIEQSTRCPLNSSQTKEHEAIAIKMVNEFGVSDEFLDKAEVCRYVEKDADV